MWKKENNLQRNLRDDITEARVLLVQKVNIATGTGHQREITCRVGMLNPSTIATTIGIAYLIHARGVSEGGILQVGTWIGRNTPWVTREWKGLDTSRQIGESSTITTTGKSMRGDGKRRGTVAFLADTTRITRDQGGNPLTATDIAAPLWIVRDTNTVARD